MAGKAKWPPRPKPHKGGLDRVYWRGVTYYTGRTGTPEAEEAYEALLLKLEAAERHPAAPFSTSTVTHVVNHWMREKLPTLDRRAQDRYRRAITVLNRVAGHEEAAAFDAGSLEGGSPWRGSADCEARAGPGPR